MTTYNLNGATADQVVIQGTEAYMQLGRDLAGIGDVNGDGIDDFALVAAYTQAGYAPGGVYVLFGKAGGIGTPDLAHLTAAQGFFLRASVSQIDEHVTGVGDVNGDGFDDFMVSDPRNDDYAGRAYLIYGRASFAGVTSPAPVHASDGRIFDGLAHGYNSGDWLGGGIAGIGDINADGIDDFFIGADTSSAYGSNAGRGWVIYGKVGGIGAVNLAAISAADGFNVKGSSFTGTSAAGLGDFNGDGIDDFVVSNLLSSTILYGKAGGYSEIDVKQLPAAAGFTISGSGMAWPVRSAGDVNGDGYADVIVHDGNRAALIFGRAGGYAGLDLASLAASDGFAISSSYGIQSVSGAGDVNGDGYDDLLVGSPSYDNNAGRAFLIYGKASGFAPVAVDTMAADAGFVLQGTVAQGNAGHAVAAAGDVNGDRIADLLVSASQLTGTNGYAAGADYLLYGTGPEGPVTRIGAGGDQLILGGAAADSLDGQGGDDELLGRGGDDILAGGTGNDRLDGGAGADAMSGGTGNDTYVVDSAGDVVTEAAGEGADTVETMLGSRSDFAALYYLPDNVEYLTGTSGTGQGVWGSGADNIVAMGDGGDLVVLADRTDFYAAAGNDTVSGGGGNDFLFFGGSFSNGDKVDGGAGSDTLGLLGTYSVTFDSDDLVGIEKLAVYGSGSPAAPNDYSFTTIDSNVAAGQTLTVVALSLRTNENLVFDGSAETDGRFNLRGGWEADTLTGGHGNDQIYGNLGADVLKGGGGLDGFEYYAVAESTAAARDTILDFGAYDRINLSVIDADGDAGNGDQAFSFIGSAAFSGAGQVRAVEDGADPGHWTIEADVNGDGNADLVIAVTVVDSHQIAVTDFYL